jgi:hypothetical protein
MLTVDEAVPGHAAYVQNYEEIGQAWVTTYVWLAGQGNNLAGEVEIRLSPRFLWRTPRRRLKTKSKPG